MNAQRTTRRWDLRPGRLIAVSGIVCASAACGGSDGNEADPEETNVASTEVVESSDDRDTFCDQVRELNESTDTDEDIAAAAEEFAALVASAPDDLRDDLEVVSEAFSEVADLDDDDPESFAIIFEVFGRPDVIEASENLERYGVEECGLEPTSGNTVDDDLADDDLADDDLADDDADAEDGADSDAGVDDVPSDADRYDEEFWGPIVATELSIPGIKQHLDLNYPETGWFDTLTGYGITFDTDVRVDGPIDDADGVALCGAILEYAAPLEPDVTITVADDGGESLASGSVEGGCSASAGAA